MYDDLIKSLRQCTEASCAGCKNELVEIGCRGLLEHEAADAIEELSMKLHGDDAAILGMKREIERMVVNGTHRWISVTERLPERNGFYLCLYESKAKGGVAMDEGLSILQFINKKWCLFDSYVVTHWLPIPEPPKEE